ncbi:MAG TPA: tetratricopeptide repeat protein [Syntrophales bacterium]|nr:tetratricopeptide repeat protein [Syntrophales bacterium]HRT61725.1 tetratricopeptide repeat protein [Syntrophales bacterium]
MGAQQIVSFAERWKYALAVAAFSIILMTIYSNSFHAAWHFDDFDNIGTNSNVHVKNLSWTEIKKSLFIRGYFARPFAYFTFGLNYYFGGLDVVGYHVVNLAIHVLTSIFLFFFIRNTLNLPSLKDRYGENAFSISFVAALLWAVNPVHVTSVTYIVQRMSSMAGLFYILSMTFYLKGRTGARTAGRVVSFTFCAIFFLLAFWTKENALMLPVAIYLYDLFLIQGATADHVKKNTRIVVLPCIVVLVIGILYRDFSSILEGYDTRPFSMAERLMTQPRVILFYLTLLIYPIPSRLMLLYDIDVSKSLLDPWTTLPAMVGLLLIVAFALVKARQWPLVSFCVLFFFINHAIEGSFLPLELIYEHRNYIPSMFLFVPVAMAACWVFRKFSGNRILRGLLIAAFCFVVADQGHTTYMRNEILSDEKTLWLDNLEKAPNSSRVHALLGKTLLNEGEYQQALDEFREAIRLKRWVNLTEPAIYQCYIGNFFLDVMGDDKKAESHYEKSLEYTYSHEYFNGMAMVNLKRGNLAQAEDLVQQAIKIRPGIPDYRNNYALVLLKQGRLDEAISSGQKALELKKDYGAPNGIIAEALHQKGLKAESIIYWERYVQREPERYYAYLALMDLYDSTGDEAALEATLQHLIQRIGGDQVCQIMRRIQERKNMFAHVPDENRIRAILKKTARAPS